MVIHLTMNIVYEIVIEIYSSDYNYIYINKLAMFFQILAFFYFYRIMITRISYL